MILYNWRISLRYAVAVSACLTAIGGGFTAMAAYTDYAPATRGFARAMARTAAEKAFQSTDTKIGSLQREATETRLQLNQLRRESLRNAKWSRAEQLKTAMDGQTRHIIEDQIEEIDDDLRDVNAERDRLRASAP